MKLSSSSVSRQYANYFIFIVLHCRLFNNYVTPRGLGSCYRDRPISMVVLYIFHASKRDAGGGWVVQKWQFQRDVIFEQPLVIDPL